jgi:DHA1 family tetracycline resistance protein-like MFS transporter
MTERVKLAVLFATLVINVFGIGIMLPVVPILVRELNGGEIGSAATIYGLLIALYSLMQFLFGPTMGALSDRFGRRPVLLFSTFGLGIDYLLLAVAPNLWIVVVARLLGGIFGASVSTASAYIADITPPERRAQSFGLIGVAFGVGFVAGPLFGGILGEYGARVPFFAAAAVCFIAGAFAYFLLPESLDRRHRRPFRLSEANPVGAFLIVTRYPTVATLLTVFVLAQFAERMLEANWVLFTAYRFEWGAAAVGISFAWVGVLFVFTQGVLVRVVIPRLGEWRTLTAGLAIAAVCMATIAFANQGWMLYAIIVPYVLGWGLSGPAIQALVTRAVPPNEQGILQGAITSAATASGIVAAPVSGTLFGYFIGPVAPVHLPGIAFLVGSIMFVAGLIVAWRPAGAVAPPPAKQPAE